MNSPLPSVDAHRRRPSNFKGLSCPHCDSDRVHHWGQGAGRLPRYRCVACKRTFNPLTNTRLARLRHKERWLTFVGTMLEHKSVRKSATICDIDCTTALRWRHRFQECDPKEKGSILLAIVQSASLGAPLAQQLGAPEPPPAWMTDLVPVLLSWLI